MKGYMKLGVVMIGLILLAYAIARVLTLPPVCATCTGTVDYNCASCSSTDCQNALHDCGKCCTWTGRNCIATACASIGDANCVLCGCSATTTTTPDPCIYDTGNWLPGCSCNITSPVDADGNDIKIIGSSPHENQFIVSADISNYNSITIINCRVTCKGGCFIG